MPQLKAESKESKESKLRFTGGSALEAEMAVKGYEEGDIRRRWRRNGSNSRMARCCSSISVFSRTTISSGQISLNILGKRCRETAARIQLRRSRPGRCCQLTRPRIRSDARSRETNYWYLLSRSLMIANVSRSTTSMPSTRARTGTSRLLPHAAISLGLRGRLLQSCAGNDRHPRHRHLERQGSVRVSEFSRQGYGRGKA